jgi:hypothetical protein
MMITIEGVNLRIKSQFTSQTESKYNPPQPSLTLIHTWKGSLSHCIGFCNPFHPIFVFCTKIFYNNIRSERFKSYCFNIQRPFNHLQPSKVRSNKQDKR